MSTFISQVNGNDIYAKRAEATRSGVNLEKFMDGDTPKLGILPEGIANPESASDTDNILATQQYVIEAIGGVAGAMVFKDVVNGTTKVLPTADYKAGWVYEVAVAGTYAGETCEVGDMIVCVKDYAEGTASSADWAVIQKNLDGVVIGPASAVDAHIAVFDEATGKLIKDGGVAISDLKSKQTAVSDPAASGTTLTAIDTISQDANGVITATKKTIQDGTTSQKGVVQLEDAYDSTSTTTAATPNAVKAAYDLANGKQDPITFEGTYDASTNKAATESTVSDAIDALDAEETSTDGTNVQVKVTQVDGVVTGVSITTDNTVNSSDVATAISGKADKVTGATSGNFAGLDNNGNLTDSGKKASDFKTVQSAVSDPTASGTATEFISGITQNENGVITPAKAALPTASTSGAGITSLSSAHDSTAENVAATPKAVKDAYDLAASKYELPSTGIPKTDLADGVQSSLDAADSALQPVSGATSGNFVGFGSNGAIQDSGSKAADFATAAQGTKADSAIQGVSVANGTAAPTVLTPDANKVVVVPVATSSAYGVVTYTTITLDD